MKNESKKLLKIVYFDEGSAIDYIDVYNGGSIVSTKAKGKTVNKKAEAKAGIDVKTGILFKALKPILNLDLKANVEGGYARLSDSAVKSIISNTVLTDYIETAEKDDSIMKTQDHIINAYANSISFIKMYTPYMKMMKIEDDTINMDAIDDTLSNAKGYFELLATNENESKIVFRFNIQAFRHNYKLVDLTKMNLKLYSVKVGEMDVTKLDAKSEFDVSNKLAEVSSEDILNTENNSIEENIKVPVCDVILAGIQANG